MSQSSTKPTLADLAKEAGVSTYTASCAVRGVGRASEKTRRLVLDAARRIEYLPNAAARSMTSGRFGSIALVQSVRESRSYLPPELLNGIHDGLAERDLNLMVVRLPDERLADNVYVPKILRETASDGLLIDYTHDIPPRMLELIEQHRVPAVWLNAKRPHDAVYADDEGAGYTATQHLLELGHRRVAYLGPSPTRSPVEHHSVSDRLQGYTRAMHEAGLAPQPFFAFRQSSAEVSQALQALLRSPDRPTAAVCYATPMQLISNALHLGLSIPDDLSIVAFDCDRPNGYAVTGRALTYMPIPEAEVGRAAVRMLCRMIAGGPSSVPSKAIPFGSPVGETCVPLNA